MIRTIRLFAAVFAAVALTATGLVAASAQASTPTTVTGHVESTSSADLRGVLVWAVKGTTVVQFSATDESGNFGAPGIGHLSAGTWTFIYWDTTDRYATAAQVNVPLVEGVNSLTNQQLELGGIVTGKVTAPSGAELKSVEVMSIPPAAFDESDTLWNFGVGYSRDDTDTDGTFVIRPLDVGSQTLYLAFDEESNLREKQGVDIVTPGDVVAGQDILNVKVPVSVLERGYTSTSRGRAAVKAIVSSAKYGIANPGGKFDLYDGSRKIKSAVTLFNGTRTVSLSGLTKGTHSFRFKYLGFTDTNAKWSSWVRVAVK